jgi:hypothetical protein
MSWLAIFSGRHKMVNVITLNNLCSLREDKKVGILFFAISQKKGKHCLAKVDSGDLLFQT